MNWLERESRARGRYARRQRRIELAMWGVGVLMTGIALYFAGWLLLWAVGWA